MSPSTANPADNDEEAVTSLAAKLRVSSTRPTQNDDVAESWEDEVEQEENLPKLTEKTQQRPEVSTVNTSDASRPDAAEASRRPQPVLTTADIPAAPPPTPVSPTAAAARSRPLMGSTTVVPPHQRGPIYQPDGTLAAVDDTAGPRSGVRNGRSSNAGAEERRPDKTTAVASRLIAAAIGQRPAPRTKEQREYDQAMRVQERKRRDAAREEEARSKAEVERARKDVWGD